MEQLFQSILGDNFNTDVTDDEKFEEVMRPKNNDGSIDELNWDWALKELGIS
jgi:hypothetical protein